MSSVFSSISHSTTSLPAASDSFCSNTGITSSTGFLRFPIKIPPSPNLLTSLAKNVLNPKQLFNCHLKHPRKSKDVLIVHFRKLRYSKLRYNPQFTTIASANILLVGAQCPASVGTIYHQFRTDLQSVYAKQFVKAFQPLLCLTD